MLGADFFVCVSFICLDSLLLKYKYLQMLVYIFGVLSNILLDNDIELPLFSMSLDASVNESSVAANADNVACL